LLNPAILYWYSSPSSPGGNAESQMSVVDLLRRLSIFADLSNEELNTLALCLGKRTFARGMMPFQKGSFAQSLYLIESGEVRIFALSETGHEITLEVYGPGECFGEAALLDGSHRTTGAMALDRTVTYTLDRQDFLRCLECYPQVTRRVLTLLAHRLEYITAYAENLAFLDVAGRVAAVVLDLAERQGGARGRVAINLRMTQADLASWVCASREMVNRVLHAYREQGLLATDAHTIVVLDMEGLRRRIAA
jgi:CRP/FNR family transcriptional regulator/CRP/FNR family cyclic AMP-dependent transcriptional regulator